MNPSYNLKMATGIAAKTLIGSVISLSTSMGSKAAGYPAFALYARMASMAVVFMGFSLLVGTLTRSSSHHYHP